MAKPLARGAALGDTGAMIATLILAGGASSRMGGRDKLLEPIDGAPLLGVLAQRALAVGPVFVTLPDRGHPRRAALPAAARIVPVPLAALGMSESLKAGIAALPPDVDGAMILPGDMPDISQDDLATLDQTARATGAAIVRAQTQDGRPGHPIYFARTLFPEFSSLTGDRGAFDLCQTHKTQTVLVTLAEDRARLDLDTPEDWARYRARTPTR